MTKIDSLLTRLNGAKKTGDGRYIARCPAHNDKSPSLAITQVDEKILLHCFAGCAVSDVLAAPWGWSCPTYSRIRKKHHHIAANLPASMLTMSLSA